MKNTTTISTELQAVLDAHHVDKANVKRIYVKGGTETYYAYMDADGKAKLGKFVERRTAASAPTAAADTTVVA